MTQVAINGKNLHKIQMRLKGEYKDSTAHVLYPAHRIKAKVMKNAILIQVPPLLAIASYHIFFRNEESISINIQNKELGEFRIKEVQYPDEIYGDGLVDILFESVRGI